MEIKRVGVYCRVSTKDQNAETQVRELRSYCNARGWEVADQQIDTWKSTERDRPGLDKIMQGASQRDFDAVLIWKNDRIMRSLSHLVEIVAELKAVGVALVSYKDGINTFDDTPYTRFYLKMMGAFAELEREMISERCMAGTKRVFAIREETGRIATKTGRWFGRSRVSKEVENSLAKYAPIFHARTMSLTEIARDSGIPRGTVYKVLMRSFPKVPVNVALFPDETGVAN